MLATHTCGKGQNRALCAPPCWPWFATQSNVRCSRPAPEGPLASEIAKPVRVTGMQTELWRDIVNPVLTQTFVDVGLVFLGMVFEMISCLELANLSLWATSNRVCRGPIASDHPSCKAEMHRLVYVLIRVATFNSVGTGPWTYPPDLGHCSLAALGWQYDIVSVIRSWKYGLLISWKSLFSKSVVTDSFFVLLVNFVKLLCEAWYVSSYCP